MKKSLREIKEILWLHTKLREEAQPVFESEEVAPEVVPIREEDPEFTDLPPQNPDIAPEVVQKKEPEAETAGCCF